MKITDPSKIKKRKTVKGVIRQVRRLLSDYENWVQEDFVTQKNGRFCYCLAGAIDAVAADPELADEVKAVVVDSIPSKWIKGSRDLQEEGHIFSLNDGRFHKRPKNAWKAIVKTLDRALAA